MCKYCPKCKTENPISAKFCRNCGASFSNNFFLVAKERILTIYNHVATVLFKSKTEISNAFTPNTFSSIHLRPKSLVKIRFFNRFNLALTVFLSLCFYLLACQYHPEVSDLYFAIFGDFRFLAENIIIMSLLISDMIVTMWLVRSMVRFLQFNLNADYIEDSFKKDLVRIAKRNRLGLFDKKKKKVCLPSKYESIELFDEKHLLVVRNGLCGIYSLDLKKVIIPVRYERIEKFCNSMTTAEIGGRKDYYDINGNRLK